ncbi:MAG TPA: UTP--glucose-1-phosphate uridylyltransferase [Planctomycetota bacterium]|nr:UTP--glucose-1-phosphate uridylyltransferase [Planctomycetota bacterium]HRR80861.1 UTP--glucose-1-phosphate uridylyltransferase [Planctomycetota bacterium]HRT97159.1 UTP--glucose-1-phosphate uridylyltransferase [Planctomycetota bacterium]
MAITKAVVPVAGLGTRLLPATKSQPKEMLPVGRKPVVQYVVEEIQEAGLTSLLFITGRSKTAIENHFDRDAELRRALSNGRKADLLDALAYEEANVEFFYTRQSEQKGLGHAVSLAEGYVRGEPFVIALGDSIIESRQSPSVLRRLIDAFETTGAAAAIAFEEVEPDDVVHYGIADPAETLPGHDGAVFRVRGLIEKPSTAEAPSRLAIAGRYVVASAIFDALRHTRPGKGGEIQLTDALRILLDQGRTVIGLRMRAGERRHDIGNFESYFRSFLHFALHDPEHGPALRQAVARELDE